MDWQFVSATAGMLVVNLVYAVVALVVGMKALRYVDDVVLKKVDLEEEIKAGNLAAAVFASALLMFVAIIVGCALGK